ncbi:MAG: rhamnose/proton symporter RhaT [Verrucomicrobia bacterium]|nr:rhamnose/proton symporter RhaT [Verrucomicrobiota bacterium]
MNDLAQTTTNPALGILIFALGGMAGAVFYLPFKKVKNWAWESYWLVYAVFGLVIVPWVLALTTSPSVISVLKQSPGSILLYCCLCGAMWGVGGLTWGLMIRYLGVGLGLAIGCGLCSATGTLLPPVIKPIFQKILGGSTDARPLFDQIATGLQSLYGTPSTNATLIGVAISLLGIVLVGLAGMSKENELPEEEKKKAVAEYDFKKGILVAMFSGIMSAGMSFGLQGGAEIQKLAQSVAPITSPSWAGMPVLVVVLFGGFLVNFLWCAMLNVKNKTCGDYTRTATPILGNLLFAGLAGAIWCSQFICFKTGEPAMGKTAYVGWAVLMASAILFSTLLGIFLGEWKGTSNRTRSRLALGLFLLLMSSVIAGYSGSLGQNKAPENIPAATK